MMTLDEKYEFLKEFITSSDALDLAFGLQGYSHETASAILYWCVGYDDFDAYRADMGY